MISLFELAYIDCALWSSTDDNDAPLDSNYERADIAPETLSRMIADCKRFQTEQAGNLEQYAIDTGEQDSQAGHDFWLTRNRHGAGFWESNSPMGAVLTEACHAFGEFNLYVGDDGMIYS